MTHFGDDFDDMDGQGVRLGAGATSGGAAGAGDDVTRFLTELRALGDGPPPEPSPELAALLGGATPLGRDRHRHLADRRALVRTVLRSAAIAAVLLGVLVVAAANHSLPAPAQRVVSNVVNVLTPFHIGSGHPQPVIEPPRPSDKPTPTPSVPSPTRPTTPPPPRTTPPPAGGGDDGGNDGGGENRPGAGGGAGEGGDDGSPSRSRTGSGGDGSGDGGGSDDGGSYDGSQSSPRTAPSSAPSQGSDGGGSGGSDDGPGDN